MKAIAVLNWRAFSVVEKIAKARSIITALTGNTALDKPKPTLADLTTAVNDLDTAQQAVDTNGGGTKWSTARDGKEQILDRKMAQLVTFINNTADGDADIIESAALDIKKQPVRKGKLDAPGNVSAKAMSEGKIRITWEKVNGAVTYRAQKSS